MKNHKIYVLAIALISNVLLVFSQEKQMQKANEMYKNYAYIDAIKVYENIAKKGFINQELLERLGDSYYFNAEYDKASTWYEKLFENKEYKVQPEYYYRYALSLKSLGKYTESDQMMNKFVELTGANDTRAILFEEHKDYREEIKENSNRLELLQTGINTEHSEYGTAFYGDKVIFAASNTSLIKPVSKWTGESFYDLYEANRDSISLSKKTLFSSKVNTKFNESTAVFTKDGNTVYFTRNNYVNKKVRMDSENTILLKILRATKDSKGNWGNVVEMPFNSNTYSVAHPALSPDEKYLYFASNMPGTLGSSDIFRVEILKNGYGKPENLGNIVNTSGRESFPFISKDNVLYYSSDGYPGLGGLDIFAVKLYDNGTTSRVINIGEPGNSVDDDFCFVIDKESKVGFLTSNRAGGKGKDDIYGFYERIPLNFTCNKILKGVVKNSETMEIISGAMVSLSGKKMDLLKTEPSDPAGGFAFGEEFINCQDSHFYLKGEKEGYETAEVKVEMKGKGREIHYEILLKPRVIKVTEGDDLAKVFKIENIYFDFDKSNIRYDASVQLAKILEVMKEYPNMKIDVRSHTDSRGSDSYNLALSDRRAKSTVKWIIDNGIDASRITGKGYGETQLTNHCSNGVKCTPEEHQANRRSEFIIISLE
ncbi:OmpA family protein [Capnocytophaga stomatis]|uniref:OmpA family protein n=1 Tax=Capnocytophaga stomatis TaxID=1848904 RepID=A0ABW8Q9W9_9FLAO|nr:OmpA family protein [Capnocytophaga stomatis]GIJ95240.1 cell envelope biogenesis protein OmpA [Capnocytophaga stomatis]GIM50494.1 cell envelope biogenesis protein OmpA [Capnocytophaga stomatis]